MAALSALEANFRWKIEPVTSGYRWVLTYNLINASTAIAQSAAGLDAQSDRFRQLLGEWRCLDDPQCFCYALSHQYTDAALKFSSLKGEDYQRVRHVADACGKEGDFYVLLASMERVVTFMNDEGGDEDKEYKLSLPLIVNLEGFMLIRNLIIPDDFLLQRALYHDRYPERQAGGEYMGNQHNEMEHVYCDAVSVFFPS